MLRGLLLFLAGALVGANVVYYVMTHPRGAAVDEVTAPPATASVVQPATAPPTAQGRRPTIASTQAPPITATPGQLAMPLPGLRPAQLVDTFHELRGGGTRPHEALDILAPAGTPVLAVADGRVEKLFTSKAGGLTVYQFEPSGRFAYYYAHLQGYAPGLAEGAPLRQGQLIGYVGSTGNADPRAPHLHFAVFVLGPERHWWQGTAIDPYPLLGGRAAR